MCEFLYDTRDTKVSFFVPMFWALERAPVFSGKTLEGNGTLCGAGESFNGLPTLSPTLAGSFPL